jgi:transcriptional regulator with XRE-family HTH domain
MSQEKLAEAAALSVVFISRLENGRENVSLDALVRIAGALKTKLTDLVEGM